MTITSEHEVVRLVRGEVAKVKALDVQVDVVPEVGEIGARIMLLKGERFEPASVGRKTSFSSGLITLCTTRPAITLLIPLVL